MEKPDLNNSFILPRERDDSKVAQWQWQSNEYPFKETDSAKWTWQNFSDDENLRIEDAYFLNQEAIYLKDYEIDLKGMLQVNIQDKNKIRRIRRQGPSRFLIEMPEPNIVNKDQRTMNEAFGNVQHFLDFLTNRTPEAYSFYCRLKMFSLDCKKKEFEDLARQVLACIEKGAEARAKMIKTRTGSRSQDFPSDARKIIDLIEKNSATLRDFLRAILEAYTMGTYICYWVNELLRIEDWEKINVLIPYLVCLTYTFQLPNYVLQPHYSLMTINDKLGFAVKHKLYLYRGTALTEDQLVLYNPYKIEYFSWNGVTSTSRDRNVAQNFMNFSKNDTKIGVIFFIEIDFGSIEDYHGLIDVSKYSKYQTEKEMILGPGTVLKLVEISLIEDRTYEIRLKMANNLLKITQKNVNMLGILQKRVIIKERAIIERLPSRKSLSLLELLRGNKLIRKLKIRNSGIEEFLMQEIENVRRTTNVRKEDIELIDNTIVVSSLRLLVHYFSAENLNEIFKLNTVRFGSEVLKNHQISQKVAVTKLILADEILEVFHKNGQLKDLWERLKDEIQAQSVSLSIQKIQIGSDELEGFFEYIKGLKSLEGLTLILNEKSIKNFDCLCQAISSSINLNQLSLKLPFSDKELNLLQNTLSPLKCLEILSLNFDGTSQISDGGLNHLKDALISLKSLQSLFIDFTGCENISEKGINHLKSELKFVQSLDIPK